MILRFCSTSLGVLLAILFSLDANAFLSCHEVFDLKRPVRINEMLWANYYSIRNRVETREELVEVRRTRDGKIRYTSLLIQEFHNTNGTITRVSEPRMTYVRPGAVPLAVAEALAEGRAVPGRFGNLTREAWLKRFRLLVEKSNEKFEERRGWGGKFSEKNIDVADRFLENSVYIEVLDSQTRKLLGGVRVITLKDSKKSLPEFEYLNIELHPSEKTEIQREVGTLFIEESLSPKLRTQIWLEFWIHIFRESFGGMTYVHENGMGLVDQAIHVYADRKSLALYLPLGFTHLERYRHGGNEIDNRGKRSSKEAYSIPKQGEDGKTIDWWPIRMDAETILRARELVSSKRLRSLSEEEMIQRMREMSHRDSSSFEFGATFEQSLRFATEDSAFGSNCRQGVVTGLREIDVHHQIARNGTFSSARVQRERKRFESRIEIFEETFREWMRGGDLETAISIFDVYFGNKREYHPRLLSFFIEEALPEILIRARSGIEMGRASYLFRGLNLLLEPQEWVSVLSSEAQRATSGDSGFLEALRAALFEATPIKGDPNGVFTRPTHHLDLAYFKLMSLPEISPSILRGYFLRAAELQLEKTGEP